MSKKQLYSRLDNLLTNITQDLPLPLEQPAIQSGWTWECNSEGIFVSCSAEVYDCLGVTPENVCGQSIFTYRIHPESKPELSRCFDRSNLPADITVHMLNKSGRWIITRLYIFSPYSENGYKTNFHGFTQIISQQAEDQPSDINSGSLQVSEIPKTAEAHPKQGINGIAIIDGHVAQSSQAWSKIGRESLLQKQLLSQSSEDKDPAAIAVPFKLGQQNTGLLEILDDKGPRKWSEDEQLLVQEVSNQLALALENAQLYETAQQELNERIRAEQEIIKRNQDLAELNQLGQKLGKLASQAEILELVHQTIGKLVENKNLSIVIYHPELNIISFPIYSIDGKRLQIPDQMLANGIFEYPLHSKSTFLISDHVKEALQEANIDLPMQIPASLLAIPLLAGDRPLGAIILQNYQQENAYSSIQVELLSTIASQAATALENANLFQEITSAFSAIENRERYQGNVARAVASLTEFGTKSLLEVLESLGKASDCSRVFFAQIQEDERGLYWRTIAEWTNPELTTFFDKVKNHYLPVALFPYWSKELREKGWLAGIYNQFPSPEKEFLQDQQINSTLLISVPGKSYYPSFIAFDQVESERQWEVEEINVLRVAADALSNTFIREDLLDQLQISLDETESLYKASHRLALANNTQEMVASITMGLNVSGFNRAVLVTFSNDLAGNPVGSNVVANWYSGHGSPPPPIGTEYLKELLEYSFLSASPVFYNDTFESGINASLQEAFNRREIRAIAILPLWASKRHLGYFLLLSEEKHQFTAREMRSYPPLVDQMAISLENLRLFQQTEASLAETGLLYKISSGIAQASNPQDLIFIVVGNIMPAQADQTIILQVSQETDGNPVALEFVGAHDIKGENHLIGRHINVSSFPFILSLFEEVAVIEDVAHSNLDQSSKKTLLEMSINSVAIVPFHSGRRLTGAMIVGSRQCTKFEPQEARLLQIAGNTIGVSLERQRLLREAQRRALELQSAAEIARDTSSTLSLETLLSRIVTLVVERFNFNHSSIFLLDESSKFAIIQESTGDAGKELKLRMHKLAVGSKTIVGTVAGSGNPVVVNDTSQSDIYFANPLLPETRSEMGIPLKLGKKVIGVLDIQSNRTSAFSQDDIAVLQVLADQIAVAIDNAKAYELSQKAIAEIRELDRLKDQFLANMSHELRTPLNSIIGFSRVILKGIDGPVNDVQTQDLLAIYNSGQHLLSLINDILDLSKIEAGKMELSFSEVNVSDLVNSVMTTAIGLVKDKSIKLVQNIPADLPTMWADSTRIRQVLLNLISNAAKFTEQGSITVAATISINESGKKEFVITVTDTGVGISSEDQAKLFQPFSQVDDSPTRKTGGTGLGLSICKSLIDMHAGKIGLLSSEPGKGSTFFFTVPIPKLDTIPSTEIASNPNAILAIDDDFQVINLYERFLKPQGIHVIACTDPKLAVKKAKEVRPFAITLDIMMPDKDGWAVMQELKSDPETRKIPVIICSILEEEEKGFSMGASDYLVKPFLQEDLNNAILRLDQDGKAHNILVIDDDPDDLRLVQKIIEEKSNYQVTTMNGGREGWEYLQSNQPDIIILDLFMPEMDGFTLLNRLQANPIFRDIPVIVLSGADLTFEHYQQLEEFGQQLLTKGLLKENELLNTLESILNKLHKK
ncbi:MAG TPA: GAF domain-containing protein [Anaerolineaceae bacterium]|nr:GAF domain-containing protein [Anaerolineaceae bacterium]